jgi:hypothetical protein
MGFELCSRVDYSEKEPAGFMFAATVGSVANERARRRIMKLLRTGHQLRHAHHAHHTHHVGHEGSHVMLPLVVISVMAIALYLGVSNIDFSELGRSALFDVTMVCVALGIAGLFGVVGAWLRSSGDEADEGFCFIGALIGAVVFYVALFS